MNKPRQPRPVKKKAPTAPETAPSGAPAAKRPSPLCAAKPFAQMETETAGAHVSRRAADRLRSGHVWVYASDVESVSVAPSQAAPALLPVADYRGMLLGTALYSPDSQIALRMVSREAIGEDEWLALLDRRLRAAIVRRKPMLDEGTNACRLCFSEADEIPGLVVDQYGGLVILQILTRGLDSVAARQRCVSVLREESSRSRFWSGPTRACVSWKEWPRLAWSRCGQPIARRRSLAPFSA